MSTPYQPEALSFLAELRQEKEPSFTQQDMADYFGLTGRNAHQTVGKWERGQDVPGRRNRTRFMGYLWDVLGLKRQPEHFAECWSAMAGAWGWPDLSADEWRELTPLPPAATNGHLHTNRYKNGSANGAAPTDPGVEALPVPAPPRPVQPPATPAFVGRTFETGLYRQALATEGLAVLSGMAGVGKTALAAVIARAECEQIDPQNLFWHSFHLQEGSHVLFWKLAGFLARHRQEYLWRTLHGAQVAGGQPPPAEVLIDYMAQTLPGNNFLLCLDDLQFVQDDPVIHQLLTRLRPLLAPGSLRLLLTTRQAPGFISLAGHQPLGGLSDVDTYHFVAAHGLRLGDDSLHALYTHTGGNAQFLTLALNALRTGANTNEFLARLSASDDVERYLMESVDEHLSDGERAVMGAVATLLGYGGSRDAVEAILDWEGLARPLRALRARYLLVASEDEESGETVYSQHGIVQRFYYDLMGRRTRITRHRRAGGYYEEVAGDVLGAARHYQLGQEFERAARLVAVEGYEGLISQGKISLLQSVLEGFRAKELTRALWAAVGITRGRIHWFVGEFEKAQELLQRAIETLAQVPDSLEIATLRARACRYLSLLTKSHSPQEGLQWAEQGLAAVAAWEACEERPFLHSQAGRIHAMLGHYDAAEQEIQCGLALIAPGPGHARVHALVSLAQLYNMQGKSHQGHQCALEALAMSERIHDYLAMSVLWNMIGHAQYRTGEWDAARESRRKALELTRKLGNLHQRVSITLNLGAMCKDQGDDPMAFQYLHAALDLARTDASLHEFELYVQCNLADLYLRRGEIDRAQVALSAAEALFADLRIKHLEPYIHGFWSLVYLAQNQLSLARERAHQAQEVAEALNTDCTLGVILRIHARVRRACGEQSAANNLFERSAACLAEEPYELALTRREWGAMLLQWGHVQAGQERLVQARSVLKRLGARRDLLGLEEIGMEPAEIALLPK